MTGTTACSAGPAACSGGGGGLQQSVEAGDKRFAPKIDDVGELVAARCGADDGDCHRAIVADELVPTNEFAARKKQAN